MGKLRIRAGAGLWSLWLLMFLASFGRVSAETVKPDQVIREISGQLMSVLAAERERLQEQPGYVYFLADQILVPHVDFARVSGLALGKHWRRASAAQRSAFKRQFQQLLVRTYATAIHEFAGLDIRYLPLRMAEGDSRVAVRTQIRRSDAANPVDVVYSMHLKNGGWLVYDVKIDGISLVTNYRNSFSREIRREGMDGLIQKLTAMNQKSMIDSNMNKGLSGGKTAYQGR